MNSNLRLVVSIARGYTRGRFELLELVSPGNEGLIIASRKFDGETGVPFGNYAAYWIKARILKYVAEHGMPVRVPAYRAAIVNQIARESVRLERNLGRAPTPAEVAEQLGCDEADVAEVAALLQAPYDLDAPVSTDSGTTSRGDLMAGEGPDVAEAALDSIDTSRVIEEALGQLPERQAEVIRMFFGLSGRGEMDLGQIGVRLGVSRERARQIKNSALRSLASVSALKHLGEVA